MRTNHRSGVLPEAETADGVAPHITPTIIQISALNADGSLKLTDLMLSRPFQALQWLSVAHRMWSNFLLFPSSCYTLDTLLSTVL